MADHKYAEPEEQHIALAQNPALRPIMDQLYNVNGILHAKDIEIKAYKGCVTSLQQSNKSLKTQLGFGLAFSIEWNNYTFKAIIVQG